MNGVYCLIRFSSGTLKWHSFFPFQDDTRSFVKKIIKPFAEKAREKKNHRFRIWWDGTQVIPKGMGQNFLREQHILKVMRWSVIESAALAKQFAALASVCWMKIWVNYTWNFKAVTLYYPKLFKTIYFVSFVDMALLSINYWKNY